MEETHGNYMPFLCKLHKILLPGSMGDNVSGAQESLYIVESALICYGERVSGLFPVPTCCLNIIML